MGTGERTPQAPKDQAPVFEQAAENPRRATGGGGGLGRTYGGQGRSANDAPSLQRGDDQLPEEDVFRQSNERDAVVIDALKAADDAEMHYRQLLGGAFAEQAASTATTVEMAGVFFQKRDSEMGVRVLSNLLEAGDNTIDATRSYAFWLADFGRVSEGRKLLHKLVVSLDAQDRATRSLLYMDIARLDATDTESLRRSAEEDIGAKHRQTRLLPISMTDYFVRGGRPVGGVDSLDHRLMSSDVRIVVTWAGGPMSVQVTEPDLLDEKYDHGAWRLQADRVFEYQMRRALPGEYKISLKRHDSRGYADALTVRVDFYTDFGRTAEKLQTQTLLMTGPELIIPGLESGWRKGEVEAQQE